MRKNWDILDLQLCRYGLVDLGYFIHAQLFNLHVGGDWFKKVYLITNLAFIHNFCMCVSNNVKFLKNSKCLKGLKVIN